MQELLKNFCFSDKNNGLLLIDMPTGTGKTYNSIQFIYNNYKHVKNKILYITNLKKNLPYSDLKKYFEKDNRLEEFEKDVLFLDNNVDFLIDNFEQIESEIPFEKFSKDGIIYNVRNCVHIISSLKKSLEDKTIKDYNSIGSRENAYLIINQERENLKDKYERDFRLVIEEILNYDEKGVKRTKAEKIDLINNNTDYQWIKKLYPAVGTEEKKIIFMSIDKFLVRNSTLVEPSYNIIDSNELLKDSIIFIDEFDSSKDVFLKKIIKDSIDTKLDIIELFRLIYAGLENTGFSKMLTEVSNKLQSQIDDNKKKRYTPTQIINEFKQKANEIELEFNLENFHKLDNSERDKASFLFQDYKFHTVMGDEKKNIYIENDKENNINWIKRTDKDVDSEETNIFSLLSKIKSFLVYFENGVKFIADNYIKLKEQRKQEENNFSYEAAIKTVLSEFGIEGKYLNYLTTQIMNSRKKRGYSIVDLKNDLDCSVYEKGFRFYNFIDSDVFDTQSKISCLSFNLSPEKILLYLCRNSKVVGISASATLKTVTGNYDLDYIKNKLGNNFYEISKEENDRIAKYIEKRLGSYDKVNIEIDKCPITSENFENILQNILNENYKEVLDRINNLTSDKFFKARYTKIIYAMDKFLDKKVKSFLFLTNSVMGSSLNFNYNFIKYVFDVLKVKHNKKAYLYTLEGALEKFENTKEQIKEKLKRGNCVFVVSTYQTLGAGQNLQYEFDESIEDFMESISDVDYNGKFKDFDAIFLDKPTNLFVTLNKDISEEQLLKYIYQVKCLEEVGYFNLEQAEKEIKKGIKIAYHSSPQKISIPRSNHIYMHTAKVILQAIGRICRTKYKRKNIFISYDCLMKDDLSKVKDEILSRPINFELKKLLLSCENVNQDYISGIDNINNSKVRKIHTTIETIRQFKTVSDIRRWEELRDIVLRYPVDNVGMHKLYDIYCDFDRETDYYYCARIKENEYNITGLNPNSITINEDLARLKLLLKIPGVEQYFKDKGYATQFQKSNHILLPNVFIKIYLGALGECIGEFLLNQYLMRFNMKLERIDSIEKYEKFDFTLGNDIYVDFKHWIGNFDKNRGKEIERFIDKLDKINGKRGFIINILKPDNYDPKQYISNDNRLIIIPYLYDTEKNKINIDAVKLFIKYINY